MLGQAGSAIFLPLPHSRKFGCSLGVMMSEKTAQLKQITIATTSGKWAAVVHGGSLEAHSITPRSCKHYEINMPGSLNRANMKNTMPSFQRLVQRKACLARLPVPVRRHGSVAHYPPFGSTR